MPATAIKDIMSLSYLVSTSGHAQAQNDVYPHDIQSINQLIREGAEELGDRTVVGFAVPNAGGDGWGCERYSYKDLVRLSQTYAEVLRTHLDLPLHPRPNPSQTQGSSSDASSSAKQDSEEGGNQIISLLCPTGLDFLVAWIACMGLGLGVVFVAPQCSSSAVAHLLGSTESSHLLYHPKYTDLAESSSSLSPSTPLIQLPALASLSSSNPFDSSWPPNPINPNHTSHIFHTSGTSGTPKPIPHFHLAEVFCLPRRPLGHHDTLQAAFTTTPLFHGGVSDLLRGWMARSTVLFYPSSTSAITAKSIVDSVTACQPPADTPGESRTTSFLSVPYILTLLSPASDSKDTHGATKLLASMEIVSTGGAPLDTAVGNGLVDAGVRLVSRLGSSECGFLLTSHRDFENDREWEWLHNDSPYASALVFEPTGDEGGMKAEMVVTNEWKSKVKSNRPDGSYVTGDIYERHATKENVWRYAGRGDDVLVMSNGEKMSPGPIEIILRSSPLIADALVVGSNRPQVGCLLFPAQFPPPSDFVQQLADLLKQANEQSPSHAQLGSEMCFVVAEAERAAELPKSSKGTIQRGVAYDTYKSEIDTLYGDGAEGERLRIAGRELEDWLLAKVGDIIGDSKRYKDDVLDSGTDLFSWGVDSVRAARLRFAMMKELDLGGQSLPMNVVFEYSTVEKLAELCESLQQGREAVAKSTNDQHQRMSELVDKYGVFAQTKANQRSNEREKSQGKTILLTGATGSLGSHLLAQFCQLPTSQVQRVICLVRGETSKAAQERVHKALSSRGLVAAPGRYTVLTARLGRADLGMDTGAFDELLEQADVVIHAAWAVHFGSGLNSFENDHIRGTRHLLDLAAGSRKRATLFFCSSLASVLNTGNVDKTIEETISNEPSTAIPIGYSQSKWVTEAVCARATQSGVLQDRVHILRIGQLCGDVERGIWNESEGWPLMLRTAKITGKLPLLREDPSWLPVDIAARAVLEIALSPATIPAVAHVANPSLNRWQDILDDLRAAGLDFEPVEASQWVEAMAKSEGDEVTNPSKKMLAMWCSAYTGDDSNKPAAIVSTREATRLSKSLAECGPVSMDLIAKMLARWTESGFVPE